MNEANSLDQLVVSRRRVVRAAVGAAACAAPPHGVPFHGANRDVPTLALHGDDDQIVPIDASALRFAEMVEGATLKVHAGGPLGHCSTHTDEINADLLAFCKA